MMLAAKPQLPSDFEATAWGKLKEAVTAIHAKRPVSYSFEELYKVGFLLCLETLAVHEKHLTIHKMIKTSRFCASGSSSSECVWILQSLCLQYQIHAGLRQDGSLCMQLVEDMCLHKMAGQLYSNLQQECDAHISNQLAQLAADQTMDPVLALEKVCDATSHTQSPCHCPTPGISHFKTRGSTSPSHAHVSCGWPQAT